MGNIIGIDLGTTFSVLAKIDENGRAVIVDDSNTESLMPSCVADIDDELCVGEVDARKMVYSHPTFEDECAGFFKREIGEDKVYKVGAKTYTPTALSALVLKKMLAERANEIGGIDEAVITIPANFRNDERQATLQAAKDAGLNISHIINEPTAAALAYSFQGGGNLNGTYAVYDLGGGTFDITIIKINGHEVEVLASDGEKKLGGIDFDRAVQKLVGEKYTAQTGKEFDPSDYQLLDAEFEKISLSKRKEVKCRVLKETVTIKREEFEEVISLLISKTEILCESTLDEAKKKDGSINITNVLCAGGSTRIPLVRESIKSVFGKEPIFDVNVDKSVALGAAIYAAHKAQPEKLTDAQRGAVAGMKFQEVCSFAFGTGVLSHYYSDGSPELVNVIMIPKNTSIPHTKTKSFYTTSEGQTEVSCKVFQSDDTEEITTDLDFATKIAQESITDLPPNRPADREVKATFAFTENGTLTCTFVDVESGKEAFISINKDRFADADDTSINDFTVE